MIQSHYSQHWLPKPAASAVRCRARAVAQLQGDWQSLHFQRLDEQTSQQVLRHVIA
jgi:hypothetical protein